MDGPVAFTSKANWIGACTEKGSYHRLDYTIEPITYGDAAETATHIE
jgi:hypothetical protein